MIFSIFWVAIMDDRASQKQQHTEKKPHQLNRYYGAGSCESVMQAADSTCQPTLWI